MSSVGRGRRGKLADPKLVNFWRALRMPIIQFCRLMNFHPTWQQKQLLDEVQSICDRLRSTVEPYLVAAKLAQKKGKYDQEKEWNDKAIAEVAQITRRIAIRSGQGPGKCGRGSVKVLVPGVGPVRLDAMLAKSLAAHRPSLHLQVHAMDEATERLHVADARCFASGEKPCVRVIVDSGQDIELSTDHPMYSARGWVEAAQLKPGDLIAAPRRLEWTGTSTEWDEDEARFVGYMLGDGSYTESSWYPSFTTLPDDGVLPDFERIATTMGFQPRRLSQRSKAVAFALKGDAKSVLKSWAPPALSKDKRLPARFWQLSKPLAAALLRSFFLCDGGFTKDSFECALASEDLIDDIQTALLHWGIHSRKKYKKASVAPGAHNNYAETKHFDAWKLTVSGRSNLQAFYEAFMAPVSGQFAKFDKAYTKYLSLILERPENTNTDIVPYDDRVMAEIAQELGVKPINLRDAGYRGRSCAWLSRQKFEALVGETEYHGKYAKWASNDIYWVKVTEVKDIGTHPVYDLEVPAYGNFVADNFIIHNTTAGCIVALWWVLQWPGARVILSAPKMQQCKDVFLAEMERVLDRGHPYVKKLVEINNTQMGVMGRRPKIWGLISVTASNPDNARGQHGEYMMILIEEASGVEREIVEILKGTLSNPLCLLVLVGNPSTRDSAFYDCFNVNAEQWVKLHWNGEETPASPWFNPSRNKELAAEFGRDSDVYRVAVLGEFPKIDGDCMFAEEDLLACADKRLLLPCVKASQRKAFGLDIARFGGDELVWYRVSGNAAVAVKFMHRVDPSILLEDAMQEQASCAWRNEDCLYIIDADGIGQGVVNQLYTAGKRVSEFHSNGSPSRSEYYANKATEAWFQLAKQVRERKVYIPYDRLLVKQLTTRKYGYSDQKGKKSKLQIESKDAYKKRTGMPSPDRADAIVMAFYQAQTAQVSVLDKEERKPVL